MRLYLDSCVLIYSLDGSLLTNDRAFQLSDPPVAVIRLELN